MCDSTRLTGQTLSYPQPVAPPRERITALHEIGDIQEAVATVGELTMLDERTYEAVCSLLEQLTTSPPPSRKELQEVVASGATQLLVAREDARLLGVLTLVIVRLPSGVVSHIEDVVVDETARGLGLGRMLARAALSRAAEAGAKHVDLTSRPMRAAANQLYQSLGFVQRETNVYRYVLAARP